MNVTEIRTLEGLQAVRPEWWDLWKRCSRSTPFLSPEWLLPWSRYLFGGGEIWAIVAWESGRLMALAPLFLHGLQRRHVSFLGSGVTDYLDFLVCDSCTTEATEALCDYLCRSATRWSCCDFQEIPPESPVLNVRFGTEFSIEKISGSVCPVLKLPRTGDALEARLSTKFRHNLRNSRNRLLDLGVVFESAAGCPQQEYVDALLRLHTSRWRSRGQPGMLATAPMRNFLRDMAREFCARGWLRFHGLRYRQALHAVVCIFCARGRWFYYLSGFDGELARFGPGNALLHFAMGQAIAEGTSDFDFLRNGERYKYRWGAEDRCNTRLRIRRETSAHTR
jgi:CelD/BcsL family acetyltransferase involved in cellulose biosynthesis